MKILKAQSLAAFAVTGLLMSIAGPAQAHSGGCTDRTLVPTADNGAQIRSATLCLLNKERKSHHRTRLHSNPRLGSAARAFAKNMVLDGFFDHTAPDGATVIDRIAKTLYLKTARSWSVGENIGRRSAGRDTPKAMVAAWMASAPHRANILSPRFHDVGLGVVNATGGTTYVTDFGRRH